MLLIQELKPLDILIKAFKIKQTRGDYREVIATFDILKLSFCNLIQIPRAKYHERWMSKVIYTFQDGCPFQLKLTRKKINDFASFILFTHKFMLLKSQHLAL